LNFLEKLKMSELREVYPCDRMVVENISPDGSDNGFAIAICVFTKKTLVGAHMNGIPCATCNNDEFINGKMYPFLRIYLCNSCQAPICWKCIQNCQRFPILIEKMCQYCAQKAYPCDEYLVKNGHEDKYHQLVLANRACSIYLQRLRNRINLRNPKFDYSKLIWAKQVNQNWRKLLELEHLFAHQHPEQIRILVTGMSPLPRRIAYRLQQEHFWGFYPQLRVKSLTFVMTKFLMRPSKHCLMTWFFCVVIERRVRAGCANHFANLLGEVDFMKAH
jgi:hypothetical protein